MSREGLSRAAQGGTTWAVSESCLILVLSPWPVLRTISPGLRPEPPETPPRPAPRLHPLSEAISDLPTRRQAPYAAWRRRQGRAAETYPATFADLVSTVITFAGPLATGAAHGRAWDPATRAWQAA